MAKSKLYFGGIPTAPDVKRLMDAFPALKPGDVIDHEGCEMAISVERTVSRYRTVTIAFRKALLNERNLDTEAVAGVGWRVLLEPERVTASTRDFRKNVRGMGRAVRRDARVDHGKLPKEERAGAEHKRRLMRAMLDAAGTAVREMAVPKPIEQLPRAVKN